MNLLNATRWLKILTEQHSLQLTILVLALDKWCPLTIEETSLALIWLWTRRDRCRINRNSLKVKKNRSRRWRGKLNIHRLMKLKCNVKLIKNILADWWTISNNYWNSKNQREKKILLLVNLLIAATREQHGLLLLTQEDPKSMLKELRMNYSLRTMSN